MFIITTAEFRWFGPGLTPAGLLRWHANQEGTYEEQQPRTDVYMVLPGQDGLGIKFREGRLEFKKRVDIHPAFNADSLDGRPESWIKWSIKSADEAGPDDPSLQDSIHWIHIRKKRFLLKHAIGQDYRLCPPPETGYPAQGIAVELSELEVRNENWWTFGIECFGPARQVYPTLLEVLPLLIKGIPGKKLVPDSSMGYPEWINRIL